MSGFTPGSWSVRDDGMSSFVEIFVEDDAGCRWVVANAFDFGSDAPAGMLRMKANAALIAAAPELYEAAMRASKET